MTHIGLSRAKHLISVTRFLERQGTRVEPLLERSHLPLASLEDPELLVPTFRIREFRELAAQRIGVPNIAFHATRDMQLAQLGSFGRAVTRQPTVYRSLVEFCNLVNTETSSATARMHHSGDGVCISHHQAETNPDQWNSELYMLIWMLKTARLAATDWLPNHLNVNLKSKPERISAIRKLGIENVTFGADHTSFIVPRSLLALPVSDRGTQPHDMQRTNASEQLPPKTFVGSLKQAIASYDRRPWLPIQEVAEIAGISIRTLQRRLRDEGFSFTTFVEDSRFEAARLYLESSDAPLAKLAAELDYSSQANFSRAFHRWAGMSPSEYRQLRRK